MTQSQTLMSNVPVATERLRQQPVLNQATAALSPVVPVATFASGIS